MEDFPITEPEEELLSEENTVESEENIYSDPPSDTELDSSREDDGFDDDSNETLESPPGIENKEDIANLIQALIFASTEIVTLKKLKEIIGDFIDIRMVRDCLRIANDNLNTIQAPFEIVEHANGFRFRTKIKYYPFVKKLFSEASARRLSQAAMEVLAIIAYKQPITKAEIESIRGVSSDGPLKNLLDRKMIALGSRSDSPGNAYTYMTSKEFLKYFGINRIPDDLPRLRELDELIQSTALVPQILEGKMYFPNQDDSNPNQMELPMGENG